MSRPVLDESKIHPAIRPAMAAYGAPLIAEVQRAIAAHPVLVIGMAQNPFPRKARRLLREAGIAHEYLSYGSYFSQWRRRLALKLWTGWPTLPMVFVRGTLIGGADDLQRLLASGELQRMLAG